MTGWENRTDEMEPPLQELIPEVWELRKQPGPRGPDNPVVINLARRKGRPGVWLLTCSALSIYEHELSIEDVDEAKREALSFLEKVASGLLLEIRDLRQLTLGPINPMCKGCGEALTYCACPDNPLNDATIR